MPFAMAIAWLLIPTAIGTAIGLKAPIEITLISFLPALPMACMLVADIVGLGEFCRTCGQRARLVDYLRLVGGLLPYQALLAWPPARAVVRQARGTNSWHKTTHLGQHISKAAVADATVVGSAAIGGDPPGRRRGYCSLSRRPSAPGTWCRCHGPAPGRYGPGSATRRS